MPALWIKTPESFLQGCHHVSPAERTSDTPEDDVRTLAGHFTEAQDGLKAIEHCFRNFNVRTDAWTIQKSSVTTLLCSRWTKNGTIRLSNSQKMGRLSKVISF